MYTKRVVGAKEREKTRFIPVLVNRQPQNQMLLIK